MDDLLNSHQIASLVEYVTASFSALQLVVEQIDKKARLWQLKEDGLVAHYLRDVLAFINNEILKGNRDKINRIFGESVVNSRPDASYAF